ncbi:MAG: molybdopterin molybdotransferase MoeA [Actinomycetota bacterium]|nr:molybdopterin molybdotransferase MoeA [Actinomycetota bacterium]
MRSVDEHAALVAELLPAAPVEQWPLATVAGLVLGADLVASLDLPPFANSAMDGYAVWAGDVPAAGVPVELVVSQDIPAGKTDVAPLQPGTAARIMTGAPIPDGADSIVPVEQTSMCTAGTVRIDEAPEPGRHVRAPGSDVGDGTIVLSAGTVLGPTQIGLAAALGQSTVSVRRPLRVLVLSTGSELVAPGNPLLPGQIYESNAPMLAAAINAVGALATVAHFVADDVDEFRSAFAAATGDVDLVVTSGGVSAGAYEVVKDAFTNRGVTFAKVAMQPGMPQGVGLVDTGGRELPVVTLPGNPVSSFVSFEVFLRPAIKAAMGHPAAHQHRPTRMIPLAESLTSIAGKRQFRRGQLDEIAGTVKAFGGPGSHLLGWLAGADCLLVIPEDVTELAVGDSVEVWDLT